ncbi:MAG TPA: YraN family protein [Bacteroidales bacterium]|nr:YraN family protein [Bacteroidales bacterium]
MMTENQELGVTGEDIARNYLLTNNYQILETNWRYGHLEVDIIAREGDVIVFCEVKTRKSNTFGNPEEAVTFMKQRNIIRAANSYVSKKGMTNEVRFDIISILQTSQNTELEHFKDAFSPRW